MERKARDVFKQLRKKFGFTPSGDEGPKHEWLHVFVEGVGEVKVMYSHSDPNLGEVLQGRIATQLMVPKSYFHGMIDCSNSRAAFEKRIATEPYGPYARFR